MKKNNTAVTIEDIARACLVSSMTVSRALRKDSNVKPETREMILTQAAQMGYMRGSRQGRPAAKGKEGIERIQLIFGSIGRNPTFFHMRLLTSIEQQLAELGYECIIRSSTGDFNCFIRVLEHARQDRSVATIILGNFPNDQLQSLLLTLPGALLLDNSGEGVADNTYSSFSFDNEMAAELAVSHLYEAGRRRILLVNGSKNHAFAQAMQQGYCKALEQFELTFDPDLVIHSDFSANDAAKLFREFLRKNIPFDAVFTNDEMATGIYKVLNESAIAIPGQIAVCGCDNLPVGEQLYPELTTVALDYDELARQAIRHIITRSGAYVHQNTKLLPRLIVKKSTGSPVKAQRTS